VQYIIIKPICGIIDTLQGNKGKPEITHLLSPDQPKVQVRRFIKVRSERGKKLQQKKNDLNKDTDDNDLASQPGRQIIGAKESA
jgi:hypothetical protein